MALEKIYQFINNNNNNLSLQESLCQKYRVKGAKKIRLVNRESLKEKENGFD